MSQIKERIQPRFYPINAEALFWQLLTHSDAKKNSLRQFLHAQKITVCYEGTTLFFLDELSFALGQRIYAPINLSIKPQGENSLVRLTNCVGIELQNPEVEGEYILDCVADWGHKEHKTIRTQSGKKKNPSGHLYILSPNLFLTLKKSPQLELRLADVNFPLAAIIAHRNTTDTWPGIQEPLTDQSHLKRQLESGKIPMLYNSPEHLLSYLDRIKTPKWEETPLTDNLAETRTFPLTELRDLIYELMNGPFRGLNFDINFPSMTYSDFEEYYRLLLVIFKGNLEKYVQKKSAQEPNLIATTRGTEIHALSAQFNAFGRRHLNISNSFFPTDEEAQSLYNEICRQFSLPLTPEKGDLMEKFEQIALLFIAMGNGQFDDPREIIRKKKRKKKQAQEVENIWKTHPGMMLQISGYLAETVATEIEQEINSGNSPVAMYLEALGMAHFSDDPRKARPLGTQLHFRLDQMLIYKGDPYTTPYTYKMTDLKVSSRSKQGSAPPENSERYIKSLIDHEVEFRAKQLLRLLTQLLIESGQLSPGNPLNNETVSSFAFYDRVPEGNLAELQTELLYLNPKTGEVTPQQFSYASYDISQIFYIVKEFLVPLQFMLRACNNDLELFYQVYSGDIPLSSLQN